MSEEKVQKDFIGFARDLQELRFTLRSALGLSPMRPLERVRQNTQAMRESIQSRQQQRQQPQQSQRCQGTATPLRGLGILDRFMQPLQPQQAEEPPTPEEAEKLKQIREDERRRLEAEETKRRLDKVRSDPHFSIVEDR